MAASPCVGCTTVVVAKATDRLSRTVVHGAPSSIHSRFLHAHRRAATASVAITASTQGSWVRVGVGGGERLRCATAAAEGTRGGEDDEPCSSGRRPWGLTTRRAYQRRASRVTVRADGAESTASGSAGAVADDNIIGNRDEEENNFEEQELLDDNGSSTESGTASSSSSSSSSSLPTSLDPKAAKGGWNNVPTGVNLPREALPKHVALIMDGNARWAVERDVPVAVGHEQGVSSLRTVVRCCGAWGVPAVTVYAFSHENWNRDRREVDDLMSLLERTLREELPALVDEGVKVMVMGDMGRVSDELRDAIDAAVKATEKNTKLRLSVALSYGSRQDIVAAARLLATKAAGGLIDPDDISEEVIAEHLSSRYLPSDVREPDLLIRTSGEQRLSNFLLWEMAYTELYFTELMWPEFGEAELRSALHTYAKRNRRFGHR